MIVLKTTQEKFLAAVQLVIGIVERRHTLPILANLLIRKTGGQVELTTTDLELQLRTAAELGGDGGNFATTVNARKLADILRAMPADQTVTLTASKSRLTLQSGRSRFTLQTLPAEEFPLVRPAADFGPAFALPQTVLRALIERVAFAMAVQDIRYFLNGVLFIADGHSLTLVATDGNRLALARAEVERALPRLEVILPRKTALELLRLLKDANAGSDDASVEVRFAAAQATFAFNGIEFVSKLIEGRFPDYQRVIPTGNRHVVTLGRARLLASLQRAAILTSERFRGIRLQVMPGALRIASSNAAQEEADEGLDIDYGGATIEIGLNVGYVSDVLANSHAEMVTMALNDAHSSVLFSFPGQAGFEYVVSPMRL
jgi:DNA polymerase-3 subunit beta